MQEPGITVQNKIIEVISKNDLSVLQHLDVVVGSLTDEFDSALDDRLR